MFPDATWHICSSDLNGLIQFSTQGVIRCMASSSSHISFPPASLCVRSCLVDSKPDSSWHRRAYSARSVRSITHLKTTLGFKLIPMMPPLVLVSLLMVTLIIWFCGIWVIKVSTSWCLDASRWFLNSDVIHGVCHVNCVLDFLSFSKTLISRFHQHMVLHANSVTDKYSKVTRLYCIFHIYFQYLNTYSRSIFQGDNIDAVFK